MMCQERIRLVSDYRETTRTYADFVRKMTDLVGLGIESEVDLLRRSCRLSWEAAEKARLALFRHEVNHSCNRSDFRASAAIAGSPNA
jgi:predicted metalloprotease with PDZ domain